MSNAADLAALDKERASRRAKLGVVLQEEEDPLAFYDEFVKWTIDNYPPTHIPRSGLLELLEEAARQFKDDKTYKGDRRYLKLWLTYAQYVDDDHDGRAVEVCKFVIEHDIGTAYAQLYEHYALTLERMGRRQDADKVYQYGIKSRARPVERLKKSYAEFQSRSSNSKPPPPVSRPVPPASWKTATSEAHALRKQPLKNLSSKTSHKLPAVASSSTSDVAAAAMKSMSKYGHSRYALMLAPPPASRRPEKLRFNLSLLFTEDGVEYSAQEARAKSMGLLAKKWAPPPPPPPTSNDYDMPVGGRTATKSRYAEPTVTLATKEALADVFGMYNSPERTLRFAAAAAANKHGPVRKLDPITPMGSLASIPSNSENNFIGGKGPTSFRPLVDENASTRKPKSTMPPPPTVPDKSKALRQPENAHDRRTLVAKEPSLPVVKAVANDQNAGAPRAKKGLAPALVIPIPDERDAKVAQPVFTPVASTEYRPSALAWRDDQNAAGPTPARFVPFVDPDAQLPPPQLPNIFARASASENDQGKQKARPLGQKPTFTPFVDAEPPRVAPDEREPVEAPLRAMSADSTSTDEDDFGDQDVNMGQVQEPGQEQEQEYYDDFESTDQSSSDFDDGQAAVELHTPVHSDVGDDDGAFDDEYEDGSDDGYREPMGGRLGKFNVMTPITERTYEFTHTTAANMSGRATPSERAFTIARESADTLAAELASEEDEEDEGEVGQVEERTGTLSLSDALAAASSFKPPNPCNPFDGPIVAALLSFIPADSQFRDCRTQESGQLESLQKFAKKKDRRSGGSGASQDSMRVTLQGRQYDVLSKLGEGGFGAVFEAVDLAVAADLAAAKRGDNFDEDEDEDEDEDVVPMVALKLVKPRNLWEFHVLRRIHLTVPARLRRSIITPETLYAYRDESVLVLELCKQGTLLDVVNNAPQAGISQAGACLDELLVMFFTIELLRLLEGLHRAGFIHGDVKIDNCLLRLEDVPGPASAYTPTYDPAGDGGWCHKGIKMIDFGRTIDTRLFPAGQRFTGDWEPDARDCLEMRDGRPWTYQTDYFGLAGIIYCMLYGKYIEASSITPVPDANGGPARYKLATPFKRYWQGDLWTRLFDVLLNSALVRPNGQLPLCDETAALRGEMEQWLQTNCTRASNSLKGLLKKVELMTQGGKDGR